ncbi:MAG: hypothetical protein M3Y85_10300 [Bacteroidota bacterium]|nr:hypothetical protein [Bacteroidota bacterium]
MSETVDDYLLENIKANTTPRRPAKHNRAEEEQQLMTGDAEEQTRQLKELDTRYQRQGKEYEDMPDASFS